MSSGNCRSTRGGLRLPSDGHLVIGKGHTGDPLAVVDRCTWSQPGKRRDHRALVALVAVEKLRGHLQRRSCAEKTVGPAAGKHFAVAQLVPDEVGNVENPGQTVHRLITGGQAVKERRLNAGVGPIGNAKRKPVCSLIWASTARRST